MPDNRLFAKPPETARGRANGTAKIRFLCADLTAKSCSRMTASADRHSSHEGSSAPALRPRASRAFGKCLSKCVGHSDEHRRKHPLEVAAGGARLVPAPIPVRSRRQPRSNPHGTGRWQFRTNVMRKRLGLFFTSDRPIQGRSHLFGEFAAVNRARNLGTIGGSDSIKVSSGGRECPSARLVSAVQARRGVLRKY